MMNVYLSTPHTFGPSAAMQVFLAGASTGNNIKLWKENRDTPQKVMNIFLAGPHAERKRANANDDMRDRIFVLESFYYICDWMKPYIKDHWHFMLDSGAFTFMSKGGASSVNWDEYVERYAAYINEMGIDLFIELDIDSIVGLKEVERLRARLESLTGKQCIPVWHRSRGKDYWVRMCDEYGYVALGGMAANVKYKNEIERFFPWFLAEARKRNTKVHALGYTSLTMLDKFPFHSIDSTAWLYGNMSGILYRFNGRTIEKIIGPDNSRLKSTEAAVHNFREWVKFQKYAEHHL